MVTDKSSKTVNTIEGNLALRRLIKVWFIGTGILFLLVTLFTITRSGPFSGFEFQVWGLEMAYTFPVIIVLLLFFFFKKKNTSWGVITSFYRFTKIISIIYFIVVLSPLFLWPFLLPLQSGLQPIGIIRAASYGIIPLELLVITISIVLFTAKQVYFGPKIKVLFLSANPINTSRIRVDEEIREIDKELSKGIAREKFQLVQKFAVQIDTLQQALLDEKPNIIHFSGHGASSSAQNMDQQSRGIDLESYQTNSNAGLVVEDKVGNAKYLNQVALTQLFDLFKDTVDCVILNACYSRSQAQAISEKIPIVIGTTQAIPDKAAIAFSVGFYKSLAVGKSIEFAYEFAKNSIQLEGFEEEYTVIFQS